MNKPNKIKPDAISPNKADGGLRRVQAPWICLLLAAGVILLYGRAAGFDFINYDDADYFSDSPHVKAGLTWQGMIWAWHTTQNASWYPLMWLSFMLDAQLFGGSSAGPHLTNVLLHTANVILLFLLLLRLTGATWRSAIVAALFAAHPLRVETVAWVSERKGLLSMTFGLLALIFYARHALQARGERRETRGKSPIASRPSPLASSLFFFVCSLLSKPVFVTLPFLLLLLDFWPLNRVRSWRRLFVEKIPFFAVAAVSAFVTFSVHRQTGASGSAGVFSAGDRMANLFISYARYLGKTFWPVNLALPYPHSERWELWQTGASAALIIGLSVLALRLAGRRPYFFVGWFWFLGTLIPVIGLVSWGALAMADRFTYLPSVGLLVLLVWSAAESCARWKLPQAVMVAGTLVVLGTCAARTWDQLHCWQNSESLFRHAIAVTKDNEVAHGNLGLFLAATGQRDEGLAELQKAIQINPQNIQTLNGAGSILLERKDYSNAVAYFEDVLRRKPDWSPGRINLGRALMEMGREAEGLEQLEKAFRHDSENVTAHLELGGALMARRQFASAGEHFRKVLAVDAKNLRARDNLGVALAMEGRLVEAEAELREVLRRAPEQADTHFNLANALALGNRLTEAAAEYEAALRLKPGHVQAHVNLGAALVELGRREEGARHLREALRLSPDNAVAREKLRELGFQE